MSPVFNINFRRAEFAQALAGSRRRVFALGVWVAYFGLLAILLGLYALNGRALADRADALERQTRRLQGAMDSSLVWTMEPAELEEIEHRLGGGRLWAGRLSRVAALMPVNARLRSLVVNPQNLSTAEARHLMEISGELRAASDTDRLSSVMSLVAAFRADSAFSAGYRSIALASTRLTEQPGGIEFVIQCR